jgi:hypothetical protein
LLGQKIAASGITDRRLRVGAMARAAGEPLPLDEPYDSLARQIGEASYRVTDDQVAAVRDVAGSDKAAFEIILAASVGAGLTRWDAAFQAIEGLDDAPA